MGKMMKCGMNLGLVLIIGLLTSCQSDLLPTLGTSESVVGQSDANLSYLLFTRSAWNEQVVDEEFLVKELEVFLFDHDTHKLVKRKTLTLKDPVVHTPLETNEWIAVVPGMYDFYFLANPSSVVKNKLSKITTREQLKELEVKEGQWNNSDIPNKGLLMTHIQEGVYIPKGGTKTHPHSFELLKNARPVELERAVAKISLILKGEGFKDIQGLSGSYKKIEGVQIRNTTTSIFPFFPAKLSASKKSQLSLEGIVDGGEEFQIKTLNYLPEYFSGANEWKENSETVPYIYIRLADDQEYQLPIVSNYENSWKGVGIKYLEFARGEKLGLNGEKPEYNLERNKHYVHRIKLNKNDIDLELNILPWNYVEYQYDNYAEVKYEVPTLVIDDIDFYEDHVIRIHKGEKTPPIHFWLQSPQTAKWKATLTNGHNFQFVGADTGYAEADPIQGKKAITLTTRAVSSVLINQSTELYFTVDGKEVPLKVKLKSGREITLYGKNNRLKVQLI